MKSKKLGLALAVLLLIALLASGCQADKPPEASATDKPEKSEEKTEGSATPEVQENKEPVEITVFDAASPLPEDNVLVPILEEKLNIILSYDGISNAGEYNTQLGVKITSGTAPDVFGILDTGVLLGKYASEGVLLGLNAYMDRIPNVVSVTRETDWKKVTYEGEVCAIPKRPQTNFYAQWVRKDWLDTLGLSMPKSLDDLLAMAVAFKDSDMDGNGQKDTYGLGGSGLDTFGAIFTGYGVTTNGHLMIKDGKAVYASTLPEFKDALMEIKKFIDAGVVDPEILASGYDVVERMASGILAMTYEKWPTIKKPDQIAKLQAVDPNADWVLVPIFNGPNNPYGAYYSEAGANRVYSLNSDLASDEDKLGAVLSMFDYVSTSEGENLVCYGIEGTHYDLDGDKIVKKPAMDELGYSWQLQFTGRSEMDYLLVKFVEAEKEIIYTATEIPLVGYYENLVVPPDDVNLADIKKYELEQIVAFIYGDRSFEEYDDFVNTLNEVYMLDKYIAAAQESLEKGGFID